MFNNLFKKKTKTNAEEAIKSLDEFTKELLGKNQKKIEEFERMEKESEHTYAK